jgi:putative membrane protein
MRLGQDLLNLLRGGLIGVAEVIPGVSGGTVALVVGIYERVIKNASTIVSALVSLAKFQFGKAGQHFKKADWRFLLVMLVGMFSAVIGGAALLGPLLENEPELMRSLFAGLIVASLAVPFGLAGKWKPQHYGLAAIAALAAFWLTDLPRSAEASPEWWQIIGAAALAVCALALPGVSGSFLLLAMGFYAPTIAAVNDGDFGYLGLFVIGAIIGLGMFSKVLEYLLTNFKSITMVVMTGLMVGSLRALWPWQTESGTMTAPTSDVTSTVLVFVVGLVVVFGLIAAEARLGKKH